jgi:predicted nucleic acid-binding protein
MSVFVDTGLFYALQNTRAQHHDEAERALSVVGSGRYGRLYTSEYVFDEAVTLVRSQRGYAEAKTVGDRILGVGEFPAAYDLLTVREGDFEAALDVFEIYRDHPLSFTDATTIALMEAHRIDALLSFDSDFDGIVERLYPGGDL